MKSVYRWVGWCLLTAFLVGVDVLTLAVIDVSCRLQDSDIPVMHMVLLESPVFIAGWVDLLFVVVVVERQHRMLSPGLRRGTLATAAFSLIVWFTFPVSMGHACSNEDRLAHDIYEAAAGAIPVAILLRVIIILCCAVFRLRKLRMPFYAKWAGRYLLVCGPLGAVVCVFHFLFMYQTDGSEEARDLMRLAGISTCVVVLVIFGFFLFTWMGLLHAARRATEEAKLMHDYDPAALASARWVKWTADLFALTGVINALAIYSYAIHLVLAEKGAQWDLWLRMISRTIFCIDEVAFCATSLLMGEVVGATHPEQSSLQQASSLLAARQARKIQARLQALSDERRRYSASAVASLLGGKPPPQVLDMAKQRFRTISWTDLPYEVMAGGAIGNGTVSDELYRLSRPTQLGECDFFLSHSWHDDVNAKWDVLRVCCEDFMAQKGRPPTLWIDKVCIDQANIETDLECLPVFLAACRALLVLAGETYTSRLWCVLELYVFVSMQEFGQQLQQDDLQVIPLDNSNIIELWSNFDATVCECACPEDKAKILGVIGNSPTGVANFNKEVRRMGLRMAEEFSPKRLRRTRPPFFATLEPDDWEVEVEEEEKVRTPKQAPPRRLWAECVTHPASVAAATVAAATTGMPQMEVPCSHGRAVVDAELALQQCGWCTTGPSGVASCVPTAFYEK